MLNFDSELQRKSASWHGKASCGAAALRFQEPLFMKLRIDTVQAVQVETVVHSVSKCENGLILMS